MNTESLWLRFLAGETLSPDEERALFQELGADTALRERRMDDFELHGLLRELGTGEREGEAFAASLRDYLRAKQDETSFLRRVQARRLSTRRRAREPRGPWLPFLAAAGFLLVVVALYVAAPLSRPRPPKGEAAVRVEAPAPEPEPPPPPAPEPAPAPPSKVVSKPEPPPPPPKPLPPPEKAPPPPPPPAPPTPEAPAPPQVPTRISLAKAEEVDGDVLIDGKAAASGDAVLAGQSLSVGASARLVLVYPDQTRLQFGPGSSIAAVEARPSGPWMSVERGTLVAKVAKQAKDRAMVFATPHGDATVLGTALKLTVDARATRLEVTQGRVRLSREGKSVDVSAGAFALAAAGTELAARPLPVEDILLGARDAKVAGGSWQFVKDAQASSGFALEAARESSFDTAGARLAATNLKTYAEFSFTADAELDYHVWVRGRTLADPALPEERRRWHDSVVLEAPGGAWSRPCGWMSPAGFAGMHRFDGYRARAGYWWIGGNHEPLILNDAAGDSVAVALRFTKSGRQVLRLYVSETPVRIDAIWLSTSRKARPDDADRGPDRARK